MSNHIKKSNWRVPHSRFWGNPKPVPPQARTRRPRQQSLAAIFHSRDPDRDKHLADTRVRLQMERDQAIRALTEP